jgi:acetyl esterase/lipase
VSTLQSEIDRAYDNAAAFPDVPTWRQVWLNRSNAVPTDCAHLDVAYGSAPAQKVDVFPCGHADAPTVLFFHGGFWSRNGKQTFRYLTRGIHVAGYNAMFAGYTLAPAARLDQITQEAHQAVAWTFSNLKQFNLAARPIVVVGWSAGAQLAAMVMGASTVKAGIGISGVYDLEPMRRGSIDNILKLDEAEVFRNSPVNALPRTAGRFITAYGERELPAFHDQSRNFFAAWSKQGLEGELLVLPGHHHHSSLDELYNADGLLTKALARLAGNPL